MERATTSGFGGAPAVRFHKLAWPMLSGLTFELLDDPWLICNTYQATRARYKSAQQFYLIAGFDPFDGNYAAFSCGREWRKGTKWTRLSNNLSALAKRFAFDMPRTYVLGYGPDIDRTAERMLADLQRVLPSILRRVTLEDLVAIENEEFGAQLAATRRYGSGFLDHEQPSEFGPAPTSEL